MKCSYLRVERTQNPITDPIRQPIKKAEMEIPIMTPSPGYESVKNNHHISQ